MKAPGVVLLVLNLAFVSAIYSVDKIRAKNDSNMFEEVVGGYADDIVHIKTQVAILELEALVGSGNIIKDNVILTVAHIIHGKDKAHLKVRAGSTLYDRWGLLIGVAAAIIHSDYQNCQECYKNDIALLILEHSAVVSGIHSARIRLYEADSSFSPGTVGRVSSWGSTEPSGPPSIALITVSMPIISNEACATAYGPNIASQSICSSGFGHNHLCHGDSGAGLVINGGLAGLAAFGRHCGLLNQPGGYTSIAAHRLWIFINTGE